MSGNKGEIATVRGNDGDAGDWAEKRSSHLQLNKQAFAVLQLAKERRPLIPDAVRCLQGTRWWTRRGGDGGRRSRIWGMAGMITNSSILMSQAI
ncbi:predicted protein [Uncinocarpus reesii 1704]|uniref:Uncharacterized protein n=1 Tax=Uncinocarpus reesii (strain UAMH 1704) TaxID=336963 RepID=C4JJW1_UNCRE|nr:uncharacterized protein UREG_01918 [Uncinocarpus reesii 1704]EEP77069.1 predicted protein [Uncinocarpus reesii 1704]